MPKIYAVALIALVVTIAVTLGYSTGGFWRGAVYGTVAGLATDAVLLTWVYLSSRETRTSRARLRERD